MTSKLFKPIQVGQMALKQRIAMAPMTRLRASPDKLVPSNLSVEYYGQRSQRPGSFIITEATAIAPGAAGLPHSPGIYTEEQINAWKKITKQVHDNGSFVYVQLWAQGRMAVPDVVKAQGYDFVSSSDIPQAMAPGVKPRPLTKSEIDQNVEWFATAAKNAISAGADGVEIHGANAYLIDQFLHECSNVRSDNYGGSIENRSRFALEVIDAVAGRIGADRTGVRFSPWNNSYGSITYDTSPIPQFSHVITEIEKRGQKGSRLAYVHVMEGPETSSNQFVQSIWKGSLLRSGDLLEKNTIEDIVNSDDRTVASIGRYYVSNPDLIDRLEKKQTLANYDFDTFYSHDAKGYTDYPKHS